MSHNIKILNRIELKLMSELLQQDEIENSPDLLNFKHVAFGLGAGLGIFFLYQLFGGGLVGVMLLTNNKEWIWLLQGIGQVVFMLLPTVIIMKYSPLERRGLLRLKGHTTLQQWGAGIVGIIVFQLFAGSFSTLQEQSIPQSLLPFYENLKQQMESIYTMLLGGGGGVNIIKGLAIGALIPAVSEEVLFRGLLQRSLEQELSPFKSILWTGIIFGVIHFNPTDIISLILIGIYIGILAYSTRSLLLPIAVHLLNNAIAIMAMNLTEGNSTDLPDGIPMWIVGLLCSSSIAIVVLCARIVLRGRTEE